MCVGSLRQVINFSDQTVTVMKDLDVVYLKPRNTLAVELGLCSLPFLVLNAFGKIFLL